MDCPDIRDAFMNGETLSDREVVAHLDGCPQCLQLFERDAELGRSLATEVSTTMPFEHDLFSRLEKDVARETGPRAWLRSRPTPLRFAAVVISVLVLVGFGGVARLRSDMNEYPRTRLLILLGVYVAGIVLASGKELYLSIRREAFADYVGLLIGALGLPFVVAFAPATEMSAHAGPRSALGCFTYGVLLTLPTAALLWAFDRDDRPALRTICLSAMALGLSANMVLGLHCSSGNARHIVLGHASIGVAWLVAWFVVRGLSRRFGSGHLRK